MRTLIMRLFAMHRCSSGGSGAAPQFESSRVWNGHARCSHMNTASAGASCALLHACKARSFDSVLHDNDQHALQPCAHAAGCAQHVSLSLGCIDNAVQPFNLSHTIFLYTGKARLPQSCLSVTCMQYLTVCNLCINTMVHPAQGAWSDCGECWVAPPRSQAATDTVVWQ